MKCFHKNVLGTGRSNLLLKFSSKHWDFDVIKREAHRLMNASSIFQKENSL